MENNSVGVKGSNVVTIKKRRLEYEAIEKQLMYFEGEILTVIDASISESRHNKAVKDLVRKAFRGKINHFWNLCHPGNYTLNPEDIQDVEDKIASGKIKVDLDDAVNVVEKEVK